MRSLLVLLLYAAAQAEVPDADAIVRRSVVMDEENWKRARMYTFVEHIVEREFDGRGNPKPPESETFDITMLEGSPFRRLIARNDKPLSADEERKEQRKLEKSIAERQKETEAQRQKRLTEWQKNREKRRKVFLEIPDAFEFRLLGEEVRDNRAVWVLEGTPRPGYQFRDSRAKLFSKFKGKLWIDKAGYYWVRAEAEAIDTISFGWFLARIGKGARVEVEQQRINDEVWLPRSVHLAASGRLGLVKKMSANIEVTYRDFRKFQTGSAIVSATELPDER
ncbi:MAG: hypothetical protein ACRD8O_02200 [Bryobacteraceae bacterium]